MMLKLNKSINSSEKNRKVLIIKNKQIFQELTVKQKLQFKDYRVDKKLKYKKLAD